MEETKKWFVCKLHHPSFMDNGDHGPNERFVRPIKGPIKEAWGLGSVWITNYGAYHGMYHDFETERYTHMFLGNTQHQALSRMNHVKSFL